MASIDALRGVLDYDPITGRLIRTVGTSNRIKVGADAGGINADGYRTVNVDGRRQYAHRIVWAMHYGEWPASQVDHINGDKSDNRISNLRLATNAQNMSNRPAPRHNTSGYKGVYFDKRRLTYQAYIGGSKTRKNLGSYPTAEQAYAAYCRAAKVMYGEFSHTPQERTCTSPSQTSV